MRRQRTTARGSERYRNYGAVLKQHQTAVRLKKIVKVFTYLLIIAIVTILLVIVVRWEKRQRSKTTVPTGQLQKTMKHSLVQKV